MKAYSRNLLIVFFVTGLALAPLMDWLNAEGLLPLHDEEATVHYIVGISFYNGFALAGLLVLTRYLTGGMAFARHLSMFVLVLMIAAVVRLLLEDQTPALTWLVASVLWEAGRAVCAAFAVSYLAHALMARYMPSTLLRVRDITPVLGEGRPSTEHRLRHCKRSRWVFAMVNREYLDTTKMELRTRRGPSFDWRSWGEATFWSAFGIIALSIYAEAYPRFEERWDLIATAVVTAHLLSISPILVLPIFPVETVGPFIPVGRGGFDLSKGFRVQLKRWIKIAFFPIIAVGLLFRSMPWENVVELTQALLITVPSTCITCMVYLECFRERTGAEIHRGIREREERDLRDWGEEPWRQRSLLEGVDTLSSDVYIE